MADEIDGLLVEIGLTEKQYQQALARIERSTTKTARNAEKQWARQNDKFVAGAQRAGRASSNMGFQVQNAAFQIGDFATQVAGGTAASRALAQQLPQLLGGFGVMGAVAGAAAAVLVPLAGAILGVGDSAASAEERIKELNSAIDELETAQKAFAQNDIDLGKTYGLAIDQARELLDIERRRMQLNAESDLVAGAEGIAGTFDPGAFDFLTASSASVPLGGISRAAQDLQVELRASGEEIRNLIGLMEGVGSAEGPEAQAESIRKARDYFIELAGGIQKANEISPELLSQFTQMEDAALRLQAIRVSEEGIVQAQVVAAEELLAKLNQEVEMQRLVAIYGEESRTVTQARVEAEREAFEQTLATLQVSEELKDRLREAWENANGFANAQAAHVKEAQALLEKLRQEAEMQRLITRYGEDSLQVTEARVKAERAAFEETLATMNVSADLKDELREAWDNANGLASVDMTSNINAATMAADQLGVSLNHALGIMNQFGGIGTEGVIFDPRDPNYDPLVAGMASLRESAGTSWSPPKPARTSSRSGGGGSSTPLASIFETSDKELQALEDKIAMIGMTSAQIAEYTTRQELLNAAKERGLDLDAMDAETGTTLRARIDQQAASVGRLTEQYERLNEKTEFWNGLQQDLKDGLIDAIVEGENLAGVFADLAKQIAKAALQAALFNEGPMSLGGASGGILGGLFGSIFSFDGGGFTGYGARSGGVDGKGGFPAILHPNETVIDHTMRPPNSIAGGAGGVNGGANVNVAPADVHVAVLDDPRKIGQFLSTAEGQAVFVETAQRVGIA